jgi:Zn-dependent oligopeptidase
MRLVRLRAPGGLDNLKTVEEDGQTKYRVSLDYPEIQPFMDNAENAELRRQLFLKNQNKGGDANVEVLEEAIRVRQEIASLLGYDSWAAYISRSGWPGSGRTSMRS